MQLARHKDTIAAIATAAGKGAVGIIRVSGAQLKGFIHALLGRELEPRNATYLPVRNGSGEVMDHGLAIYFPAPHSYTGEDVLELQMHGGSVMLQLLLARCLEVGIECATTTRLAPMRLAAPGEFTERAFLNEKLDLVQAEAVADLIDASTEAAAKSASRALEGAMSREIAGLRDGLVHLRMLVEATMDFPEEDIDFLQKADAHGQLKGLRDQLDAVTRHTKQGSLLREGIRVVIAGQPNAGKSSLLNALAGAELAIVTPVPGTTRDKVQQTIQIEGVPLHVIDTAGLRESDDQVEKIGISRTWEEIERADAVIFLHDLTRRNDRTYMDGERQIEEQLKDRLARKSAILHVWNKSDAAHTKEDALSLSAKTGEGLGELRRKLLQTVGWESTQEGSYIARARHVQALLRVQHHLRMAEEHLAPEGQALDLLAEELRQAQNALNEITGEFTPEDLLGEIFSRFCIGK